MSAFALRLRAFSPGELSPDLRLGFQNLMLHKLRSLLTMLGMIFGVAAVVSMMSIRFTLRSPFGRYAIVQAIDMP